MTPRKQVDWPAIEADYRAGIKSVRQIGRENGIPGQAIHKRAKSQGWDRDLSARIRERAREMVIQAAVGTPLNTGRAVSKCQIADANAELQKAVLLSHRESIRSMREVCQQLLDEAAREPDAEGKPAATRLAAKGLRRTLAVLNCLNIETERSLSKHDRKADGQT